MIFSRREYKLKEEDRTFLDYIPPASILIGGIVFLVGTILAILLYETPEGGYRFFDQFFSELGIRFDHTTELPSGGTEQRYAPPFPDIFNVTLYASGFLTIPFFMFSYRQMRNANRLSNFFLLIATIAGVIAGPIMIGVGIFDLGFPAEVFWEEHGFWVASLYLLISITTITWLLMLITSSSLPYRDLTRWILLDYLFLLIVAAMVIINLLDGFEIVLVEDLPYLNEYSIEAYQKLIAYVFFGYYGLIVGIRLSKTKYDNTPIPVKESTKTDQRETDNESKIPKETVYCTACGEATHKESGYCTSCGAKIN